MRSASNKIVLKDIRGIIWDFDGTILDSFGVAKTILREVAEDIGIGFREAELANHFHGSLRDTLVGVFELDYSRLTSVEGIFLGKQDEYYKRASTVELFKDALSLIQQASDNQIRQIIVTNRDHTGRGAASPRSIVGSRGLDQYIERVICGDEVEYRKPDVRVLGDWLQYSGIDTGNTLVVGDQLVDVELARNLGAEMVLIARDADSRTQDYPGVFVVDDLSRVGFG